MVYLLIEITAGEAEGEEGGWEVVYREVEGQAVTYEVEEGGREGV